MRCIVALLVCGTPLAAQNARGLELIGRATFNFSLGDIWVHEGTAYLGTYSCGMGIQPVDITNPSDPRPLAALATSNASTYEDVIAIRAATPHFQGNLLAAGLQSCRSGGAHGVQFWDVTDPRNPRQLGFYDTGARSRGVHEMYLFQREDRVYALLAVPNSEAAGEGGDFRIIDATDPSGPVQAGQWGIRAALGLDLNSINQGASPAAFLHSVWANAEGTIAYLSYWDAGIVLLDISDPAQPRFLGRAGYAPGEEGNAHSVWPAKGGSVLLLADEDFSPGGARLEITAPETLAGRMTAVEGNLTRYLCATGEVAGEVAFAGRACSSDVLPPDVAGRIVLVERGECEFREKVLRVQEAGAAAVVISNNVPGPPGAAGGDPNGVSVPVVMVSLDGGTRLKSALMAGETLRAALGPDPNTSWGFLRILDVSDPSSPRQLSDFATENARRCPPPDGGIYSIHNPFVAGDTAYLAWYSDGVRVLDIGDPAKPLEIAYFVPPDREDGRKTENWGVFAAGEYVYLSDITTGFYVLRKTALPPNQGDGLAVPRNDVAWRGGRDGETQSARVAPRPRSAAAGRPPPLADARGSAEGFGAATVRTSEKIGSR